MSKKAKKKKGSANSNTNSNKKDSSYLPELVFKIVVFFFVVIFVLLTLWLTRTMNKNTSMLFESKVKGIVSNYYSYYSMKYGTFRKEADSYLKENNIQKIVIYRPGRVEAANTDEIPFRKINEKVVNGFTVEPNQVHDFAELEPCSYTIWSNVDFSRDLEDSNFYLEMVDDSYAKDLFMIKMVRDFVIVAIFAIFFIVLYAYNYVKNMRESLEKKNDLVTLGSASRRLIHEIKNPVAAIMMQVSLLEKMHPTQVADYDVIKTEAKRIVNLTDRIREFMSDSVGNVELINVVDFMKEEVAYFKPGLITTNYFIGEGSAYVYFDKTRLRSIIINVIQNGLDAQAEKPEQKILINVSSFEVNRKIKIEVLDWGTGIKESDSNKIFNPFFTTKTKGTGIGLSISKQFLNARGGTIELNNRYDDNGKVEGVTTVIILDREKPM